MTPSRYPTIIEEVLSVDRQSPDTALLVTMDAHGTQVVLELHDTAIRTLFEKTAAYIRGKDRSPEAGDRSPPA